MIVPSPQTGNGYLKIANEIIDALVKYRIPGEQMQCCLYIIRKTYGYNKKKDMISNSQFCEATGLKKGNVTRAIKNLVDKKVVIKSDNTRIPTYEFNKHYTQWKVLSKKQPVIKKATTIIKSDNKSLSKVMDTKDNKNNITKNNIVYTQEAKKIISHLNNIASKKFKDVDSNLKIIIDRLKEGYSTDECLMVIDNQSKDEWFIKNPKYMCPSTLFRAGNFSKYLENKPKETLY